MAVCREHEQRIRCQLRHVEPQLRIRAVNRVTAWPVTKRPRKPPRKPSTAQAADPAVKLVEIALPLHLVSEANARDAWFVKAKRTKSQRGIVGLLLRAKSPPPVMPVVVTITRIAPRSYDDDNMVSSAKGIRDEIADWLGVNDRSKLITWAYEQRRGKVKEYAVTVRVERKE